MKKKYIISLVILFIMIICALVIEKDYKSYSKNSEKTLNEEAIIVNLDNLSINYYTGNEFQLKSNNNTKVEKKFSVTNMSDTTLYYYINLDNIDYEVKHNEDMIFKLTANNDGTNISNTEFPSSAKTISGLVRIAPSTTQNYTLEIIYKSKDSETFVSGRINVAISESDENSFGNVILVNNPLGNPLTTPGKKASETNEGLLKTEDDDGDTYYFRGDVENNYVMFADYLWRIVRVNGDGGVRLILDEDLESLVYNANTLDDNRTDYYTLASFKDSSIKEYLDEWFNNKLSNYSAYIQESKFCDDLSIEEEENNTIFYSSYDRLITKEEPSLVCKGETYKANVGLLTADEVLFAGAYRTDNAKVYLYKEDIALNWWTSTPYTVSGSDVTMFSFNSNSGSLANGFDVKTTLALRPVISLRSSLTISGTGTKKDPYIIK